MTEIEIDRTHVDEAADDLIPAPADKAPLLRRRPAEVTEVVAGLPILAAYIGFDLPEPVVIAFLAVLLGLPAVTTWAVNLYRDALRDLG